MTWDHGGSNSYRMGAEGKFDLKLCLSVPHELDVVACVAKPSMASSSNNHPGKVASTVTTDSATAKGGVAVSVLTSRKCSSTSSLPEVSLDNSKNSVASTEQAASAENLMTSPAPGHVKMAAEAVAESVLNLASHQAIVSVTNNSKETKVPACIVTDFPLSDVMKVSRVNPLADYSVELMAPERRKAHQTIVAENVENLINSSASNSQRNDQKQSLETVKVSVDEAVSIPLKVASDTLPATSEVSTLTQQTQKLCIGPIRPRRDKFLKRGSRELVVVTSKGVTSLPDITDDDDDEEDMSDTTKKNEHNLATVVTNPMSVSVPNLSSDAVTSEQNTHNSAQSLFETFAAVARRGRNLSNTANNVVNNNSQYQFHVVGNSPSVFNTVSSPSYRGPNNVSSLVRLALSSNLPG